MRMPERLRRVLSREAGRYEAKETEGAAFLAVCPPVLAESASVSPTRREVGLTLAPGTARSQY